MTASAATRAAPDPRILPAVHALLAGIVDPEIPAISIVDLGIVGRVTVQDGTLEVEILPTFIGCPALDLIRATVDERLESVRASFPAEIQRVNVRLGFGQPWTADRITDRGRAALARSGFAPPELRPQAVQLTERATCPFCGSRRTLLENAFGPTRCRSIHYCTDCRQPFEQFKDA